MRAAQHKGIDRVMKAEKRLKKALEPFIRAYRVGAEPFEDKFGPKEGMDQIGMRDFLPGVWPTAWEFKELVEAAIANNMDYQRNRSKQEGG